MFLKCILKFMNNYKIGITEDELIEFLKKYWHFDNPDEIIHKEMYNYPLKPSIFSKEELISAMLLDQEFIDFLNNRLIKCINGSGYGIGGGDIFEHAKRVMQLLPNYQERRNKILQYIKIKRKEEER